MGKNIGFDKIKEERKMSSFFKIFQSSDLSSESMRAFPQHVLLGISKKDFSFKMVIRAQWGMTWDVEISKNPRFYYMEKRGWDKFVNDNALGENEFITFTHRGKMNFQVNIYEQNGKEMLRPRNLLTMGSSSRIKKEEMEFSYKEVKKEEEEVDLVIMRKAEEPKTLEKKKTKSKSKSKSKSKRMNNAVEEEEKQNKKSKEVAGYVPEFKITIRMSYLKFLAIPKHFVVFHIPNKSRIFTVRHPNGIKSWKVFCLVTEIRTILSAGYSKLAREYPLLVGDECTFKLIKPFEFLLVVSKQVKAETSFRSIYEQLLNRSC